MDYFNTLDPLLRIFWFVAIPVSTIFVIQTIMTFAGIDSADGVDADFDGDLDHGDAPFQLFSFRNLINFLMGLGWTGISFFQIITNKPLLIGVSVLVGAGFVLLFFIIMKQVQKLSEDNSFRIESTLKKTAYVYLRIPEQKTGHGKIQISVNGSFREIDAMTSHDSIPSGSTVLIVSIENPNLVLVEKI